MGKEFKIESKPKTEFRIAKISPVDLLAIATQINFDKFEQTQTVFKFALESIEAKVGEAWLPVKYKDRDVYSPSGIEDEFIPLNELVTYFMVEVIGKTFQKSSE